MSMLKLNNKITVGKNIIRAPKVTDIIPCFLLFLSGRASVIGMYPFGMAMFCAVFRKNVSYLGILTLVLSALSAGAGIWTYKYVLGAVLFWLYTRIREDYRKNPLSSSFVSGACLFLGGLILTLYYPTGIYDFMVICIESVLCAFFYIVYDKASALFSYSERVSCEQEVVSSAICLGILISGVSDINLPLGINPASILTMFSVMCIAMHENLALAGTAGLGAGFICSMNELAAVTLMGFYGLAAMFSNLLNGLKKFGVALGFLGGAAVTLLYIGNNTEIPISIFEVTIAATLFVLFPDKWHNTIGVFFKKTLHPDIIPNDVRMREYVSDKLRAAATVFSELSAGFSRGSGRRLRLYRRDVCKILDEVTDRVCRTCPNFGRCWRENYANSYRIVFSLLEVMEKQGVCVMENAPVAFLNLCAKPEVFLSEFWHVYELYKTETINIGRDKNSRDIITRQYSEIAEYFLEILEEVEESFNFIPELEQKIAKELDREHIGVVDVRVIECEDGKTEVYIRAEYGADVGKIEELLTDTLKMPMGYRCLETGGAMHFEVKEELEVSIGSVQLAKEGQQVSGDKLICFHGRDNRYYVILCDGMGSGEAASRESEICAEMTEKFLRAGFSPKMTLSMVNSALSLKPDSENFSSVDLLVIDLSMSQADFYKVGGSKSFIWHDERVEAVFPDSLPAGMLPEVYIGGVSRKIEEGDILVMMSDGVCDSTPGFLSKERMNAILSKDYKDMNMLCDAVINSVLRKKHNRAADDMTVAAIKISANES